MSGPHEDKPLARVGQGWLPRLGTIRWLRYGAALMGGVLVLLALFHGCGRRPLVRPTPQMDLAEPFWVRVLLLADATECMLEVPAPFRVTGPHGRGGVPGGRRFPASNDGPMKVTLADGRLALGATPLAGNEATIAPERPFIFSLDGRRYRGRLRLVPNEDGRTFDAINLVPLEPYLAGVVGAEMPDYWEPQALRAQAIAARTYCLYIKGRFGARRGWDVGRTQANQVYAGISAESAPVWNAVNSTCGQVLVLPERTTEGGAGEDSGLRIAAYPCESDPPSARSNPQPRRLFPAYYSSICGGHTADSEEVFGDRFEPLRGVPCPYCREVAKLGLFFWPMVQFDGPTVTKQLVDRYPNLAALGAVEEIVVAEKSDYDRFARVNRIKLVGATGRTDTLRAEDLRLALDPTGRKIRSTICQIVPWGGGWAFLGGRGWGHGVGMCQCGAEGMARLGHDAEDIMRYYYPGCEIVRIY